jgi:hypothetical protein
MMTYDINGIHTYLAGKQNHASNTCRQCMLHGEKKYQEVCGQKEGKKNVHS